MRALGSGPGLRARTPRTRFLPVRTTRSWLSRVTLRASIECKRSIAEDFDAVKGRSKKFRPVREQAGRIYPGGFWFVGHLKIRDDLCCVTQGGQRVTQGLWAG